MSTTSKQQMEGYVRLTGGVKTQLDRSLSIDLKSHPTGPDVWSPIYGAMTFKTRADRS